MKRVKEHLEESNMGYSEHLAHSVKQSNRLIVIAIKSYLHGLFPWMYASAGPLGIYRIYKEVKRMHHIQRMYKKDDETN
jgi:hypothetical protein